MTGAKTTFGPSTMWLLMCTALACIREWFDQPGYQTYHRLENLLASAANGNFIAEFYGDHIARLLQTQMELFWSITLSSFPNSANICVRNIVQHVCTLSLGVHMNIMQVCTFVCLLLVMPATNAVSQQSVSALRRVRTYLRTTMSDKRLNNLLVLQVHNDH